ncbi:YdjC family protein [Beutenbergia cavernae DSM 12333]|uniref:YdjC family protein n=1 Tax=Beutenbergia cavernae (strain ATCC BAA-8 / DSM 12333 / CCUG 43141 / JCM 11478 / NBRC 16432 / NCIMB 13614 / HKI 0122) TaxID=471853 RepID=C5C0J8_BEUC1|nr:polysaccharide deacetylase family protein [Beutenbergia cavernae]ACQ81394.1 YdjC family protein [Beutenbergia cavernae DSM 12333]
MTRELILTADDFGIDPESNAAITSLARDRLVTATSIITVADAAEEALAVAGSLEIAVGLHVTFTSTAPHTRWRPASGRSALADADGYFPVEVRDTLATATSADVHAEIEAQLGLLRDAGIRVTHLDLHTVALYGLTGPGVVAEALDIAARERLGFRLPRIFAAFASPDDDEPSAPHAASVVAADGLGVRLPRMVTSDPRPAGLIPDYESLRASYLLQLEMLPEGLSEMFLHPSLASDRLADDDEARKRAWEHAVLRDPVFRTALEAFTLTHW